MDLKHAGVEWHVLPVGCAADVSSGHRTKAEVGAEGGT